MSKRLLDPFDVMRAARALAPHDPRLNDRRWLAGESLRRVHARAQRDGFAAVVPAATRATGPKSRVGPVTAALYAREKLAACEAKAGPASWPILKRLLFEGQGVRDCRDLVPEVVTPWRADAVISDRLRVALDALAPLLGV